MRKSKNTSYIAGEWVPLRVGLEVAKLRNEIERLEASKGRCKKLLDEASMRVIDRTRDMRGAIIRLSADNKKLKDELSAVCEANDQLENRVNDLGEQVDMWRRLCYDARQERNEAEDQLEDATGRATKDRWVEIKIMPLRNSANVTVTDQGSSDYILSYGSTWTFKVKI